MAVEIANAVINLTPSLRGMGREIERQVRGVDTRRAGATAGEGYTSGFKGSAAKLTGILGGAFAAVKIGGFAKDAISQASDLNEVGTKLQAVFGDGAKAVTDFSNQGAKALGQTSLEAQNAAATFGVFGKAAGLTAKDNAEFSTGLASLATDMASFSNTTPEQAIDALGAGLRGETEPLRAYGVLLDDASLRQEALSQGLITTTKDALTPQQKVLASHALILKQTKDAQGDFARTSGGLANQQRILSAQWTDAKGKLGQAFLPGVTAVVAALNDHLFPIIDKVTQAVPGMVDKVKAAWGVLTTGDFKGGMGVFEDSPLVGALLFAHDTFTQLHDSLSGAWSILAHGDYTGGLGGEDSPLVNALFNARDMFGQIGPTIKEAWSILAHGDFQGGNGIMEDSPLVDLLFKVRDFGLDAFEKLQGIWDTLWGTAQKLWEPIKNIAGAIFDAVQTLSGKGLSVWDILLAAFQKIADVLDATLVPVFTWLGNFMKDNAPVVLTLVGALSAYKVATMAISVATKAWGVVQGVLNAVMAASPIGLVVIALAALAAAVVWAYNNVDWFRDLVDKAWVVIQDAFKAAWGFIQPILQGIGDMFVTAWNSAGPIFDFFKRAFDNFLSVVQGMWSIVSGIFTGDWARVWDGVKGIFSAVWDQIKNVLGLAWEALAAVGPKLLELGGWILSHIWDGIKAFVPAVLTWFGTLPGLLWDAVVALGGVILEYGGQFLKWIYDGITGFFTGTLLPWFAALPSNLWNAWSDLVNTVLGYGVEFLTWIYNGITGFFTDTLLPWFIALPGNLWNAWSALVNGIIGYGIEFLTWIYNGVTSFFTDTLLPWFGNLPSVIWEKVSSFSGWIVEKGRNFIGWIKDGIVDGASAIWDFFKELPGKAWEALKKISGSILDIGKNFVGFIISGIAAVADDIWTAIKNALTGSGVTVNGDGTVTNQDGPTGLPITLGGNSRGGVIGGYRGRGAIGGSAAGGVIPGTDPGRRDNMLGRLPNGQAWGLRSEEAVMVPEFTHEVGGAQGVYTLNRLAEAGRLGEIMGLAGGFADGGMVGLTGRLKQVGSDGAWAAAKKVISSIKSGEASLGGVAPEGARGRFMQAVASKMGTEYVWGAAGPNVFDCSGLISWALEQAGVGKGRLTAEGFNESFPHIPSPSPGDMVTFDTGRLPGQAGHIGMVLNPAQGTMMHTDGAGPARTSDYLHRGGLLSFLNVIGGASSAGSNQSKAGDPPSGGAGAIAGLAQMVMSKLGLGFSGAGSTSPQGIPGPDISELDSEQSGNARAIASVAISRGLGRNGVLAGIVTAITESTLHNVAHGDAMGPSSTGLFQQMPPWGPYEVRMSPTGSAGLFYDALTRIPGWQSLSIPMQAQSVEQSEFSDGSNYARNMAWAERVTAALGYPNQSSSIRGRAIFDQGGMLGPNSVGVNLLNKPEAVLTPKQTAAYQAHAASLADGYGGHIVVNNYIDGQQLDARTEVIVDGAMVNFASDVRRGRLQPTS